MSNNKTAIYGVIGASSSIGRVFYNDYKKKINFATSFSVKNKNFIKFDILNDKIDGLLKNKKITHLVIFAAESKPDECFKSKNKTKKINYSNIVKIISYSLKKKITPIIFSSEFVFSGKTKNNSEKHKPNPILEYGEQKLNIEKYVIKNKLPVIVFRLAKVYGDKLKDKTLITQSINDLKKNNSLKVASDQYFSPIYVRDVVKAVDLAAKKNITGLYNLSGPRRYSRYQIVKKINKFFDLNRKINPVSIDLFKLPEKRPKDVSLNNNKLKKAINYNFKTVEDVIKIIKQKYPNVSK